MSQKKGDRVRTVELTTRERDLLLEYGYPFTEQEKALRESVPDGEGIHRVEMGVYWIEHLQADLAISEREIRNRALLRELDELYSQLESALNSNPGESWE